MQTGAISIETGSPKLSSLIIVDRMSRLGGGSLSGILRIGRSGTINGK